MIFTIAKFIIEVFLVYWFMSVFNYSKYKHTKKIYIIISSLLVSLMYFIPKELMPLNSIIGFAVYVISCKFVFKNKLLNSFLQALVYIVFLFICECVSVVITISFSNYNSANELLLSIKGQAIVMAIYYIIYILVLAVSTFVVIKRNEIRSLSTFFTSKQFINFVIILIITFIPQIVIMVYNKYDYKVEFLILNIIQIVVLSLYMIYSVYTYLQKEKYKNMTNTLEIDNQSMVGLIDGVRTIKHDFNNIFQSIHGYLCVKDYEKLDSYVNSVMKECNILNNISFLNREIFDDSGIYGIVGSKQFYANSLGILFELDVQDKVSHINFPMPQLGRILGIILDNAIDATQKAKEKYIKLEIKYVKNKNAYVIKVYNTFDKTVNVDLKKIYDKGYSSKKVKSGIGLWEVKKIINNNKNSQIYPEIENEYFVQNIIIEN